MRTLEQAERVARRQNKKRDQRAPLLAFAGLVAHVTAADILAQEEKYRCKWQKHHYEMLRRAAARRKRARAILERAEFDALQAFRRRVYPRGVEYDADFWWEIVERGKRLADFLNPPMLTAAEVMERWGWD